MSVIGTVVGVGVNLVSKLVDKFKSGGVKAQRDAAKEAVKAAEPTPVQPTPKSTTVGSVSGSGVASPGKYSSGPGTNKTLVYLVLAIGAYLLFFAKPKRRAPRRRTRTVTKTVYRRRAPAKRKPATRRKRR